jgi:DNA modification methylase
MKTADPIILEPMMRTLIPKDFLNTIVCGDALQVMRKIPDDSIEVVITSPPYNLKNSTGNGMKDGQRSRRVTPITMTACRMTSM